MPRPTDAVRLQNQAAQIKTQAIEIRVGKKATRELQKQLKLATKRAEKAEKALLKLKTA